MLKLFEFIRPSSLATPDTLDLVVSGNSMLISSARARQQSTGVLDGMTAACAIALIVGSALTQAQTIDQMAVASSPSPVNSPAISLESQAVEQLGRKQIGSKELVPNDLAPNEDSGQASGNREVMNASQLIQDLQRSTAIYRARAEEAKAREALEIILRNSAGQTTPPKAAASTSATASAATSVPTSAPPAPAAPPITPPPRTEPVRAAAPERSRALAATSPPSVIVIYGRDKALQASIRLANGVITDVREGDELDDGSRVHLITSKKVMIEVEGQRITLLAWAGNTANAAAAAAAPPRGASTPPLGPAPNQAPR